MAHVTDFKEAGFDSVLEELEWRGLISQSTDRKQLAEALNGEPVTYYCGFDPTAASLHIGNLVQLINMRHLQAAGHHPIALVGGATGLIGDPRQSGERTLNPKDVVAGWAERLKRQIGGILETYGDNPVRFVSNYDWTAQMSVIDFLRDVGKNFRLGTMLAKDTVARRLNSEEGISFTEFSYQVLQGNDFLHLFDEYGCTLEIGGSDQWGNLTSGMDLIRKVRGVTVNVFTSPIITDATGKKFGKSEGNAVWLDATMLSPYRFYQFWFNRPDVEMEGLLKAFTFLPKAEIERLAEESRTNPGAREAQRTLAWEVTSFVHEVELRNAITPTRQAAVTPQIMIPCNLPFICDYLCVLLILSSCPDNDTHYKNYNRYAKAECPFKNCFLLLSDVENIACNSFWCDSDTCGLSGKAVYNAYEILAVLIL